MTITEGLKYPFNRFSRLFNFYWILIPILGWLAVPGYCLKIIQNIVRGNKQELPEFGSFFDNMKAGFFFIIFSLIIALAVMIINIIPIIGTILAIIIAFISPILIIQYTNNQSFSEGFDFKRALNLIFNNFIDFIVAYLRSIIVFVILVMFSIPLVTLIITIPAMSFVKYYFFAEFYSNVAYKKPKVIKKKAVKKRTTKKRRR